jgi:penicillin-binding protein 1A
MVASWLHSTRHLGGGEYGVSAASQAYFGNRAQDLTLAEAAFLAGIPEKYPFTSYRRHTEVLDAMIQAGKITSLQAEAAKAEPLDLKPPRTNATNVGQVRGP